MPKGLSGMEERKRRLKIISASIQKAFLQGRDVYKGKLVFVIQQEFGCTKRLAIEYLDTLAGTMGFSENLGMLRERELPDEEIVNWIKELRVAEGKDGV